jgi:hypothetical protein
MLMIELKKYQELLMDELEALTSDLIGSFLGTQAVEEKEINYGNRPEHWNILDRRRSRRVAKTGEGKYSHATYCEQIGSLRSRGL